MSKRKFLGAFVPGLAIVILLGLQFDDRVRQFVYQYQFFHDRYFIYAVVLILGFLLGLINLQISFRLLDLAGGRMDTVISRITNENLKRAIKFCSDRLHVFNLCTLDDETKNFFGENGSKEEFADPYWTARMAVVKTSYVLAQEIMDIEGDINFYAGMFLPLIWLGIFTRTNSPVAAASFVVALIFALRFQHLRHDDIAFVANAAKSVTPR